MLQDPVDGIAKEETFLGKKCHGEVFNANKNGFYHDLHATDVSIVSENDYAQ